MEEADDIIEQAAFDIIEQAKVSVAAFTGMRQQFIDSGWSREGAEAMVLEMLRKSTS